MARRPCGPLHRSVCKPCRAASNLSRDEQPFPCNVGDSPDPRQRPFGSGQRPYPPGYGFPVPFGGWPSLLGSSCARCGIGPFFRRSSGLLAGARPQRGCRVPHRMSYDGGGRLLYCGAWVSMTGLRAGAGPVAHIAVSVIFMASFAYAASMKVHLRSPFPSFPGPVGSDDSNVPWASPACSRTLRYLALAGREPTETHIGIVATQATTTHSERLSRRTALYENLSPFWVRNSA